MLYGLEQILCGHGPAEEMRPWSGKRNSKMVIALGEAEKQFLDGG
jgi:hypothetical protein